MSVNDTGAECSCCGSYNCSYLCGVCALELLLINGVTENEAVKSLEQHGIYLNKWEIAETSQRCAVKGGNPALLKRENNAKI